MSETIVVSVILVTYKSENYISRCLDSIARSKGNLSVEVIVVDNYPLDSSAKLAKSHPLKPLVISPGENLGYSKGVNLGIKSAKGQYILLLNPDTILVGRALERMVLFAMTKQPLGAVAPKLIHFNGKIQGSIYHFPTVVNAIKYFFLGNKNSFRKYYPGNRIVKVEVAIMAAFLIPKSVIDTIGGLDERFFMYYEDIEFNRRLARNNLPVYFFPKATVKHISGASGNFKEHLQSPLAKSAQIYHGKFGSFVLNLVLWIGRKYQRSIQFIKRPNEFFLWVKQKMR